MKCISRHHARQQGLPRFFTGEACEQGHVVERYTMNSRCVTCMSEQSREAAISRLTRPRRIDWTNLSNTQIQAWYDRINLIRVNHAPRYRHRSLECHESLRSGPLNVPFSSSNAVPMSDGGQVSVARSSTDDRGQAMLAMSRT